ncbi:MAG: response regulator [Actinobacteria bacterium]|nr:MAG: response regulator [Actinomycetota bacterium]
MAVRVVVAEDEALIRADLVEMLADAGYEVVGQASTGEAAVELVRLQAPDVVLLDVRMPAMDGLTAAELIRGAGSTAVVMLTAYSEADLIGRARDAGAGAYLVKPVVPGDLVPAIEMALARSRDIAELSAQVRDLHARMTERKVIERAKAVIQARLGLDEEAAFAWLRRTAMDRRTSMAAVAEAILAERKRD